MISFHDVTAGVNSDSPHDAILKNVSVDIPSHRRTVILGHTQSGKTTLINLLAGLVLPSAGSIERYARLSFPIGYWKIFDAQMTVRGNLGVIAENYGSDPDEVIVFLDKFLSLGPVLEETFSHVSRQMKVRLSYALGYVLAFDTYLIDNAVIAGDTEFQGRCLALFEARIRNSGMILATSRPALAKQYGEVGGFLEGGKLTLCDDIRTAVALFMESERRSALTLYQGAARSSARS